MKEIKFEFLEHTADIKYRLYGSTLNEIFENSVLAIASYMSEKPIKKAKIKTLEVSGQDSQSLLCNFIDELLYLIDAEGFIAREAKVLMRGNNLKAELYGDDIKNYSMIHIKAATYSEMYIKKSEDGWEAQIVLDV